MWVTDHKILGVSGCLGSLGCYQIFVSFLKEDFLCHICAFVRRQLIFFFMCLARHRSMLFAWAQGHVFC